MRVRTATAYATGAANRYVWLIRFIKSIPALFRGVNRLIINFFATSTIPRPHRFSLWSPSAPWEPEKEKYPATQAASTSEQIPGAAYASWPGLVDRTFTGRHLPPASMDASNKLPSVDLVIDLFKRKEMQPNPRSSTLFCFFAQWFTDSFLRTHPSDDRRNTSNHEIDLCQIYGLDESSTWSLRSGEGGHLRSWRDANNDEYPWHLYKNGELDPEFYNPDASVEGGLSYLRGGRKNLWADALEQSLPGTITNPARRDHLYAAGLDRGNSTIVYSAFNTIFLREHNRIADLLAEANPDWDDNRLFETARLVNIRQLLTVVVNDYIYHIGGLFPFALDRTFAERKPWYRTNRISIEFNLLYRWHSLAPDFLVLAGRQLRGDDYRFNNALLEQHGVEQVISDASRAPAGRMGLFNTPYFLEFAERKGLAWARLHGLRPFNEYREHFGFSRYTSIDEFADGTEVAENLKRVYGDNMDAVEFTVGLFAEKRGTSDVMPETLRTMVAYDAFTHILTNPVLAGDVHRRETFSDAGWEIIEERATLEQIVRRNTRKEVTVRLDYSAK